VALGRTRQEIAREIEGDEALTRHLEDLRAHRPFRNFVYSHRDTAGQLRFFHINGDPIHDASGRFVGYRGTGRDITAMKQADERLREAIEAMTDGFVLWGPDDRVVMVNSAFLRMDQESFAALKPGTRFEDIMRTRVYAGRVPAAIGREEDYIRERLAQHRNPTGQPIVQHLASGQWVRIVERRTRDGSIVAVRSDISDLQRQQTETLRAKEQAEEASRAKSRFLATMSHELRTPLNAIIGFSEVMQTNAFGPLGSPKYAEYAAAINASGRHLLNLIGDILDMSRIEAGRYTLHATPLELGEVVREAFLIVQGQAEERGLILADEVDRALPRVDADRLAVKQILINLLSNAIRFTARGGRIAVTAQRTAAGGLTLAVRDTGIGIAPERLPHLFDPFSTTADAALARGSGGTGLGLSICKRLIELHGGEIAVVSEPGRGTVVSVAFPPERVVGRPSTS
jgi:signal transduction histidine kinase